MDKRGQSALEYLMTYGWALIVIAIVIGVLIFVTGSATGGVTCQSQSTGIQLTEWSVTQASVGLTLRNATGGEIDAVAATSGGEFTADVNSTLPANIAKNTSFTVTGLSSTGSAKTITNGTVNVGYTTQGGLDANAVIVCSGTVA